LEGELKQAQSNYNEARAKHREIKVLLGELYPKLTLRMFTPEEYAAYRESHTSDIVHGRAALQRHYPCTPSRHADVEDRQ